MPLLTPTVRLNSFAVSKHLEVIYTEEKEADSGFQFSLRVDGVEVRAEGQTKQKAKHNAAQKALDILKEKYADVPFLKEPLVKSTEEQMHDILSGKGHVARFQYTSEEGGTDNRIYTIECIVEGLVAKASGKGRKNAREEVCRKMLHLLNENSTIPKLEPKDELPEKELKITDSLQDCIFDDPISILHEYLVHNNLDPPTYTCQEHGRIYSITCKVGSISSTINARNKKLAKHCTAAEVLTILEVKEKPKKKPKRKMRRGNHRFLSHRPHPHHPPHQFQNRQNPSLLTRSKIYEPSQRALNYNRRQTDRIGPYYDIF